MRYRIRDVSEVEAMQWEKDGNTWLTQEQLAHDIVAWVNTNGGDARFERLSRFEAGGEDRIVIRTRGGLAFARPGDYVEMGNEVFVVDEAGPSPSAMREIRPFYRRDAETFEKRWEPVE